MNDKLRPIVLIIRSEVYLSGVVLLSNLNVCACQHDLFRISYYSSSSSTHLPYKSINYSMMTTIMAKCLPTRVKSKTIETDARIRLTTTIDGSVFHRSSKQVLSFLPNHM